MVFAEDEAGTVYWYHPAWTDRQQDPAAVPVRTDGKLHELKEAVRHAYRGRELNLYGLFLERSMRVQQVEDALQRKGKGTLSIPGVIIKLKRLKVTK
jgi:hypothetical protein